MPKPRLIKYGPKDRIPADINRQLLCLNFRDGGEMLQKYCFRKIDDSTVLILLDNKMVVSWVVASPWYYERSHDKKGYRPHELNFYTRISERHKGHFETLLRECLRTFKGPLALYDNALTIAERKFKRSKKRFVSA